MATSSRSATRQVLQVARYAPGCRVEELVLRCSGFRWQEVFEALIRLKRSGRLRLVTEKPGLFRVNVQRRQDRTRQAPMSPE